MSNETKRWYVKAPDWMSNETQGWLYKFAGCSIHTISGDKRKFTPDEQFTTEEIKKYHLAGFETVEVPDEQRSELNDELYEGLFSQYDAALPDETEKQKKCPYCHNKYGLKISQDAYSFWYRNKRFKPLFCSNCGRKL